MRPASCIDVASGRLPAAMARRPPFAVPAVAFQRPQRSIATIEAYIVIEVLECLKKYGQRLDLEIAKEMRLPLPVVRQKLESLAASGAIVTCTLTRFENGTRIDAWQCRLSGYAPPLAPGRKAKAKSSV